MNDFVLFDEVQTGELLADRAIRGRKPNCGACNAARRRFYVRNAAFCEAPNRLFMLRLRCAAKHEDGFAGCFEEFSECGRIGKAAIERGKRICAEGDAVRSEGSRVYLRNRVGVVGERYRFCLNAHPSGQLAQRRVLRAFRFVRDDNERLLHSSASDSSISASATGARRGTVRTMYPSREER